MAAISVQGLTKRFDDVLAVDHLRVLAVAAGIDPGRADQTLELTGLAAAGRRRVGGFSLGMRQRLGLAAAGKETGHDPARPGRAAEALLRDQVAALVVGLLWWSQGVERALAGLLQQPGLERWLPLGAASALTRPGDGSLPMWAGALVFTAYGLVLALLGARLVVRRDLT